MATSYVPCPACGKLNRVSLAQSASKEPICGHCRSALPLHFGVAEVSARGLRALVEKCPVPVVCDFWAPWCSPCNAFAPVFQQAANRFSDKATFAKLNTEQHSEAGEAHRVRSIPTLIIFSVGAEKHRLNGALGLEDFSRWLSERLT